MYSSSSCLVISRAISSESQWSRKFDIFSNLEFASFAGEVEVKPVERTVPGKVPERNDFADNGMLDFLSRPPGRDDVDAEDSALSLTGKLEAVETADFGSS